MFLKILQISQENTCVGVFFCEIRETFKNTFLLQTTLVVTSIERFLSAYPEAYSELYQTSKMKCFAKIVSSWKPFITFAKVSIWDAWQYSEYPSVTVDLTDGA